MYNILHISKLNKNEINEILKNFAGVKDNFNVVLKTEESLTSEDFIEKDLLIFGIGDDAANISEHVVDILQLFDSGVPLLFTHGTPDQCLFEDYTFEFDEIESYDLASSRVEIKNKELLLPFSKSLGVELFDNGEYVFYDTVRVKSENHKIMLTPNLIKEPNFKIKTTHSLGHVLNDASLILIDNPGADAGFNNFYLAIYQAEGKGKVAFFNIGHNDYDNTKFNELEDVEMKLFVNVVYWLLDI